MTGSRNLKLNQISSDSHLRKEEVTSHFNRLTKTLEVLKGSDACTHFIDHLNKTEDQKSRSGNSSDDDNRFPIVGISSDRDTQVWSDVPVCPLQTCEYTAPWSNPIVEFVQREELNKAIGFWMNIKKPSESLHCPYTSLKETIGTNEVLNKPQTPVTTSLLPLYGKEPSDGQKETHDENDLANTIPVDIGKSLKKFCPGTLEPKSIRTPPLGKAREASAPQTASAKATKSKRRLSRNGKALHRLVRTRREPLPPRSPTSTHREARPPQPPLLAQHLTPQQPAVRAITPSTSQRAPATRSRSSRRLARSGVPGARTSQLQERRRNSPLRQARSRGSTHRICPRTSTSARYHSSGSNMRLIEVGKFSMRTSTSGRQQSSRIRRLTPPGNVRASPSFFGLSRNSTSLDLQFKNSVKKKKKIRPKSPTTNRTKTTPSQISRVHPVLDLSRSRNAFQQTDNNVTSTSIQANLLPQQLIEYFSEDSKPITITSPDTSSQGTQTILTSEHKCVAVLMSNNTDNVNLKPLLMSRTAQTNPRVKSTKVATRNFLNGRFTDSDMSLYNSRMSLDKPYNKLAKVPTRTSLVKPKASSTTSAVSSLATDSRKFGSRQSSYIRFSHWPRNSFFNPPKGRLRKQTREKMSDTTVVTAVQKHDYTLFAQALDSETRTMQAEKSFDLMIKNDQSDFVSGVNNKRETKVVRTQPKKCAPKFKSTIELSPKTSNPTSTDTLATKTSQIPLSSLPSDKVSSPDEKFTVSDVCDKSFKRFVNRMRATQMRLPTLRTKGAQRVSKDKELARRDPSKPLYQYGTLSHPALHLAKNKVVPSINVKSGFSINNKVNSKINTVRSKNASEFDNEDDSKILVKKNIDMLVQACRTLLSEAMKSNMARDKCKREFEPTTQETVAWILRTLKTTYGNVDTLSKEVEDEYIAVIEQECQTSSKVTEIPTPTELKERSVEVSKKEDINRTATMSSFSYPNLSLNFIGDTTMELSKEIKNKYSAVIEQECQTSSKITDIPTPTELKERSVEVSKKEDINSTVTMSHFNSPNTSLNFILDNTVKLIGKIPENIMNRNEAPPRKRSPCPVLTSPSKCETLENDLLHLNCGNFSVALRQVQDNSIRASQEEVMENKNHFARENDSFKSLDGSSNVLSKSSINLAPVQLPNINQAGEVTPVTRVSMWSKSQDVNTSPVSKTLKSPQSIIDEAVPQIMENTNISTCSLDEPFQEDNNSKNVSGNNRKGKSSFCDANSQQSFKSLRDKILECARCQPQEML